MKKRIKNTLNMSVVSLLIFLICISFLPFHNPCVIRFNHHLNESFILSIYPLKSILHWYIKPTLDSFSLINTITPLLQLWKFFNFHFIPESCIYPSTVGDISNNELISNQSVPILLQSTL